MTASKTLNTATETMVYELKSETQRMGKLLLFGSRKQKHTGLLTAMCDFGSAIGCYEAQIQSNRNERLPG